MIRVPGAALNAAAAWVRPGARIEGAVGPPRRRECRQRPRSRRLPGANGPRAVEPRNTRPRWHKALGHVPSVRREARAGLAQPAGLLRWLSHQRASAPASTSLTATAQRRWLKLRPRVGWWFRRRDRPTRRRNTGDPARRRRRQTMSGLKRRTCRNIRRSGCRPARDIPPPERVGHPKRGPIGDAGGACAAARTTDISSRPAATVSRGRATFNGMNCTKAANLAAL